MKNISTGDKVFVDASAFIALYNLNDSCHNKAVLISRELAGKEVTLAVAYEVILETATVLRRKIGLTAATDFLRHIQSGIFFILSADEAIRCRAEDIFLKRKKPKDLGLFDCLYFSLMETYEIRHAFSFDSHFTKYGIECLSLDKRI